jgi:hypothetical protein
MEERSSDRTTLSRSADHLGTLATTLRDLVGPESILNELTQNADDALGEGGHATTIRFTVSPDHLEVWNDGTFSDCGFQRESRTCPWKESRGQACDLHAFRLFAGRNKSRDSGKTGAFGVGFTSVYQLTDHPELLTGDWHWTLDESADENDRIQVCEAAACAREHGRQGTTFVLPWAREQTLLRTELGVPPVSDEMIRALEAVLERPADALLFLKRVRAIETITSTGPRRYFRYDEDLGPVISDGTTKTSWLVITADLGTQADEIIEDSRGLIEPDRDQDVSVAIPLHAEPKQGVLYASLPTQTASGFGGHINASFFPKTDRKGVRFDNDPESAWNRLAVRVAAQLLADKADLVLEAVGPKRLWELLVEVEQLRQQVDKRAVDEAFLEFAIALAQVVPSLAAIETVSGARSLPREALLPRSTDIYSNANVLEDLGLRLISQELHPLVHGTSFTRFGIAVLAPYHLVEHLTSAGITNAARLSESPLKGGGVTGVLKTLEILGGLTNLAGVPGIADVAIVPCRNGWVAPASGSVIAGDDEAALFELIDPDLQIVDESLVNELCPRLSSVCPRLTLSGAADVLLAQGADVLQSLAADILEWLDGRSGQLDAGSVAKFAALPIYPSSDGTFYPLGELSLRSGFSDPLGIAELVDDQVVQGHTDLLRKLGARELDVVEYFTRHVIPRAHDMTLPVHKARGVLEVISASRARLETAQIDFSQIPVVPCQDGELHRPADVYLDSRDVRLIAPSDPIADTTGFPPYLIEILIGLGVARAPRLESIAAAALRLSEDERPPEKDVAEAILRAAHDQQGTAADLPSVLSPLMDLAWLPTAGGGRRPPAGVLPTNQRYLYGRQGAELDLPPRVQTDYFRTLEWLGMPSAPSTEVVARHLRHSADNGHEVNSQVYVVLSRAADSPHVQALRDVGCIQLSTPGTFAHPSAVFWQPTPFGRWAHQLPVDRRPQQDFFDAVGVKESPGPIEIMSILDKIASEFGNDRLDESAEAVVHACWAALAEEMRSAETEPVLAHLGVKRSALDTRGVLTRPDRLFFRDGQGVSDRFALLAHEVIRREKPTWRALAHAGVARVEELFTIEPHELLANPDESLPLVIAERRAALLRVLEGHTTFDGDTPDVAVLDDLEVLVTGELQVQYRASLHSQVEITEPTPINAVYLHDQHRLIYREGSRPRDLARELARALDRDGDTALLAMAIEQVIGAESLADAHDALSAYGIADLDQVERTPEASQTIEEGEPSTEVVDHDIDEQQEEAGEHDDVAEDASSASGQGDSEQEQRGSGGTGGAERSRQKPRARQRGGRQERLRSYVFSGDDGDRGTRGDEAADRSPTDVAGVQRVVEYERSAGRTATEMPHENPGFDVESFDKAGELVRRIEVKSTAAEWSVMGVMLSKRQIDQARADGDLFWLYVVEYAGDDEKARVYRIQDPANRISYFGFDGDWKVVAEPALERDEGGTPTALNTRRFLGGSPGQSSR